jgi:hypothetical protein
MPMTLPMGEIRWSPFLFDRVKKRARPLSASASFVRFSTQGRQLRPLLDPRDCPVAVDQWPGWFSSRHKGRPGRRMGELGRVGGVKHCHH